MSAKDSGMRIRVEKEVRDAFVQACHARNRPAAEVLRDFMRSFTEEEERGQADLFSAVEDERS
jgi:hypothetical protein